MSFASSKVQAEKETEPPSRFGTQVFLIGRDCRGHWVVRDKTGHCGGLFANRDAALRFVRSENGNCPPAVVMVSGTLELDMTGGAAPAQNGRFAGDAPRELRVA